MILKRPYLLITLVGLLLYASTAFFGLTYLDDNVLILESYGFLSKLSSVAEAFRQGVFHMLHEYAAAYRPLLTVSFILDTRLDALLGLGYHFSNIVFHLIASCLVFLFFVRLKYGRPLALFGALIFTVHPALTQAVAWIPGRNDSLLGIFILSSFICFLDFIEYKRWPSFAGHLIFFVLALFTKEAAIVLPLTCFTYLFAIAREKPFLAEQRQLIAGWCLALAVWLAFRIPALSSNPAALSASGIAGNIIAGAGAIVSYLGKSVFPFDLSIIPTIEDTTMVYGVAAAAAIILGLVLSKAKRYRYVLFGAVWFLLFLTPTFIQPVAGASPIFLESRLYLPILGAFIVLGEIDIVKNIAATKPRAVFGVMIICLFFVLSVLYERNFKDAAVFWKYAAKHSPHSSLAQYNLGWVYSAQGDPGKAEEKYRQALALNPRQRYVHNSLGIMYERRGDPARAEAEYSEEIHNTPYYAKAYLNLASLYYRQGRQEKAVPLWERAVQLNPEDAISRKALIAYYYSVRDFKKAYHHADEFQKMGGTISQEFIGILKGLLDKERASQKP